jgi:hypothetical protein
VFTDADISERPDDVAQALRKSKVLFCSLVVDFVQVQWIKERYRRVRVEVQREWSRVE